MIGILWSIDTTLQAAIDSAATRFTQKFGVIPMIVEVHRDTLNGYQIDGLEVRLTDKQAMKNYVLVGREER